MIEQRFCTFCGTLTIPGAAFCVKCGQAVAAVTPPAAAGAAGPATAAAVIAPPAPPPAAAYQPPAAPATAQPPAPAPPPPAPGGPPPTRPYAGPTAAPALPNPAIPAQPYGATPAPTPAGGVTRSPAISLPVPVPVAVGIAAVAVVAVVAAFFLLSGSGSKPGITYNPSSLSCAGESFTVTMRLPASVGSGDYLAMLVDGQVWPSETMWTPGQGGFARQSDSTWFLTTTSLTPGAAECGLAPGNHTLQIVDANGLVLGQGSLTRQ